MDAIPDSTTLYFGPWYTRSPFFEATRRARCSAYDVYNHAYIPAYYRDPVEEYWHLLENVTLWDVGVEHIVQIKGPDALEFTNLLTCREPDPLRRGQCKYAPLIDADGGIVNDPVLLRPEEDTFWLALADSDAGLWARGVAWGSRPGRGDLGSAHLPGPGAGPARRTWSARCSATRSWRCPTTTARTPHSTASPSCSDAPAGPARSATRSTS